MVGDPNYVGQMRGSRDSSRFDPERLDWRVSIAALLTPGAQAL